MALEIATRTGELLPGSSITTPGPTNTRSNGVSPPMNEVALNMVCAPSKLNPATKWLFESEQRVGVGDLRRRAVGIGVGGLVVQLGIGSAVQEIRDERAAQRGAGNRRRQHSSPVPSLQGVSFGALPLVTRCRK